MSETQDNFQTLLNAGAATTGIRSLTEKGGIPFAIVPNGYQANDLERLLPVPTRKRAAISVSEATSFIDYLNMHSIQGESVIYADIDSAESRCVMLAVIDDHAVETPAWRDHTCVFSPKQSVEWVRWNGRDRKALTQSEFATWLEDNLPDVASVPGMPTGADILAMALGFEANSDKRLRSKMNLQSGSYTLEFVDEEKNDTRTTMTFFERFTIGIPVFDGSPSAYPIEARLKYREKSGVLSFWYELIRPDRVFKTAVSDELANIKQGTGLLVISGKPNIKPF